MKFNSNSTRLSKNDKGLYYTHIYIYANLLKLYLCLILSNFVQTEIV